MFKMIFMMLFWSGVAFGAVYWFAVLTGDHALQSKIIFFLNNIMYAVSHWWQGVQRTVAGWADMAQRSASQGVRGVDIGGIAKAVKLPTGQ